MHHPTIRTSPPLLVAAVAVAVLAALLIATTGHAASTTTTTKTTPSPPLGPNLIGKPVVFKWGYNKYDGHRFSLVFRTDGSTRGGVDASLNGIFSEGAGDGGLNPIFLHPRGRYCYQVQFTASGKDMPNGQTRFYWLQGRALHGVQPHDVVKVAMRFGWGVDPHPGPWINTTARVFTAKGPRKTDYGQATLQNKWPQEVLARIGCAGKLRPWV